MPMKCWQPQIFYICKPYLFFHIYDTARISCLAVMFVFLQMSTKFLLQFISEISYLEAMFVLSHLWPLVDPLFGTHILFSLFYPNISWNCTRMYIQNTDTHDVLCWQLQIFDIISYICSFTSMMPLVFHVWQSYLFFVHAYDVSHVIHKHFTLKLYTIVFKK